MIAAFIGFTIGGVFGFVLCALLVATEDDKEGRQ